MRRGLSEGVDGIGVDSVQKPSLCVKSAVKVQCGRAMRCKQDKKGHKIHLWCLLAKDITYPKIQ